MSGASANRLAEVFAVALRLGLTSFGGPIAHLGYFEREYVESRRWLDRRGYGDLVALGQFLPGPASSQVGAGVGTIRAGYAGGALAWLGFTLPSAVLMVAFAAGVGGLGSDDLEWLDGLKIVAVAVVALAVWSMARTLTPDLPRLAVAAAAAAVVLLWEGFAAQIVVIAAAGLVGWRFLDRTVEPDDGARLHAGGRRVAIACLATFAVLLAGLPLLARATASDGLDAFDGFYRAGALVFGGGHVVLPLLQTEVVEPGWVSEQEFVAGYGAAQAVPGPLFTFAGYLGYVMEPEPNGVPGAVLALVAIFLPGLLLLVGALPFWDALRLRPAPRAALRGVNAAVVGILAAALYDPVWRSAIDGPADAALALGALLLLTVLRLPPWAVVVATGLAGAALVAWG